jgi:galactose mutarotase-like enzyme
MTIRDPKTKSTLEVDVKEGFNTTAFYIHKDNRTYNVLYKEGAPILFPFANRLLLDKNGRFSWTDSNNKTWNPQVLNKELVENNLVTDNNFEKSVRHGFAKHLPFEITNQRENSVTGILKFSKHPLLPEFYSGLNLEITHTIENTTWTTEAKVINTATHEIPISYCIHYWFNIQLTPEVKRENCVVTLQAQKRWEAKNNFPTGKLIPVTGNYDFTAPRKLGPESYYDDVFLRTKEESAFKAQITIPKEKVTIEVMADDTFKNMVFYVPESKPKTICIEPQTSSVDMFKMHEKGVQGNNLITIQPGERRVFKTAVTTTNRGA